MRMFWRVGMAVMLAAILTACVSTRITIPEMARYEFDRAEMGSPFRIVLYAPSAMMASNATTAAYERIAQLNNIMSDYQTDSEVSELSRTAGQGKAVSVSHDLWTVLERAEWLSEKSDGAFDVTVGPYSVLWRQARREGAAPNPKRLAAAASAVGYKFMRLRESDHSVELLAPKMRLDLGGIAKGYAVSQAMRVLKRMGIASALVSGGGDLEVSAPPPEKSGWRIELPPLDAPGAPPSRFLNLHDAGLSTSGDLFQRLETGGKRFSHIIDPRTGIGLTDHSLVNVIAPDDFTADGLTKVMSILPPKKALRLLKDSPHASARIVRQPGEKIEVYESRSFAGFYEKTK